MLRQLNRKSWRIRLNVPIYKEGKFVRPNYPEGTWYVIIKDSIQTEYLNNGKDYIKSTLVFVDDCNYKAIVMEKSDKNDPAQIRRCIQ